MNAIAVYVLTILLVRVLLEIRNISDASISNLLIECVDKLEVNEYLDQGMQMESPTFAAYAE